MRAEEGDETVNDYAEEAKHTKSKIDSARSRAEIRPRTLARRFFRLWRGEHGSH
ncbi:hypothetical protein [Mycobacterium bourgelatii]|uniref:Uncharacterized protein n=1 Tax=Mycobacterium bourgelatii TaxID=1273442 RepID=A0A7I9YWE1_MYCBU|nr:hypothetical protein [Mycobacterium bourgelatii]MCV6978285.1 hypothetical protein [Mycobacterium bourgelatii]GFG93034.1 hypothetical protein MBOU_50760 [Mycobacterium bourgelatii]